MSGRHTAAKTRAERRESRAAIDDPQVVMDAAAAFLAVRPRSVEETRRRLRHLGYRHTLVDQVVERLIAMHYLDDEAFARSWVESRDRARPRGENALRRELVLKGVPREVIDAVLNERAGGPAAGAPGDGGSADEAAARRLIERRRAALERERDPRRRRQKAYALLARNGFAPDVCASISQQYVAEADQW